MSALGVTGHSSPLSGFPQFSKLPAELRLIIWGMAMEPRTIPVLYDPPGFTNRKLTVDGVLRTKVPKFFFINRECRAVAEKKYLPFDLILPIRFVPERKVLVNFLVKTNDMLAFHMVIED